MIPYGVPNCFVKYDIADIYREMIDAKAAMLSLSNMPYQKDWFEELRRMELKREIAGTTRIEGADFTENELDKALEETPKELATRSQRQAHSAMQTYRWISELPSDRSIDSELILEIHRRMITGADDDNCEPGKLRPTDHNVTFGRPIHRGVRGGDECKHAFDCFVDAINGKFGELDPILQAFATHYHLVAMHPFPDGNGRTARALEALMLQRAGLKDVCFIAMSNYYYEERVAYVSVLTEVRKRNFDLTSFFQFGLKGMELQIRRILQEANIRISKAIYRNLMYDLFKRLKTPRKRVIADRQIEILKILLDKDQMDLGALLSQVELHYSKLKTPDKASFRDIMGLFKLGAISLKRDKEDSRIQVQIRLDWPKEITETDFMERIKQLPKARSHSFLD